MEKLPVLKLSAEVMKQVGGTIDLKAWVACVFNGEPYEAMNGEEMQRQMLLRVLEAETVDEVLSEDVGEKLQDMVPNFPDASTPPLELISVAVLPGDAENDPSTYLVIRARDIENGGEIRFSTGATNIQVQMMRILSLGVWPIKCIFKRVQKQDQGGRYIFRMSLPD